MARPGWLPRFGAWLCLALLILGGIPSAFTGLQRSAGMRELLRALQSEPASYAQRMIPCAGTPIQGDSNRLAVKAALDRMENAVSGPDQSAHLLGTAHCLLGDLKTAEELYQREADSPYAGIQLVALYHLVGRSEASLRQLEESDLSQAQAVEVLTGLIQDQPGLDWRPHLQSLVTRYPQAEALWQFWWKLGLELEREGDWQSAAGWFEEGKKIQDHSGLSIYTSSFDLQIGRYFQVYINPPDPETALKYYNQALEKGQYYSAGDHAYAFYLRGEVYQTLKEHYTAQQALREYQQALSLAPDNYWFQLGTGRFFASVMQDPDQAERYYLQAQQLQRDLPAAYSYLGELYRSRDDPAQAEAWYRQALARQPDYQPALEGLKALGVSP